MPLTATELARRAKLSAALKGRTHTEETRAKIRAAIARRSPEMERARRAKIGAYWSGRKRGEEFSAKMRGVRRELPLGAGRGRAPGFKHSPETIAKMRSTRISLGFRHTPETRARISALQKGRPLSAEHKAKIGAAHLGKTRSPEAKQRMGESARRPEVRERLSVGSRSPRTLAARVARLRRQVPTRIELAVRDALTAAGVEFVFQYPVGPYVADFFLPAKNLILEVDGHYWHSLPGAKERDARRDADLVTLGYRVVHIPEHRIKSAAVALLGELVS